MTGDGGLVEVQATAERTPLSRASLDELLALAADGIERLRDGPAGRRGGGRLARTASRVRLVLATRNEHKLRELAELLRRVRARAAARRRCELPPETGHHVRRQRARARRARRPSPPGCPRSPTTRGSRPPRSAGAPGVWSARYAGDGATDEENLAKLLREVPGRRPPREPTCARSSTWSRAAARRSSTAAARACSPTSRAATAASATTRPSCPSDLGRRPHDGRARPRTRRTRSATAAAPRARSPASCGTSRTTTARPPAGASGGDGCVSRRRRRRSMLTGAAVATTRAVGPTRRCRARTARRRSRSSRTRC